jgi:F0F1-type ATP synthase membrane subunit b/b'
MRIIEAIKKAEAEAEQMRLEATKQVEQLLEEAKVTSIQETKMLQKVYDQETIDQEKALTIKIQTDQEALQAKWQKANQELSKFAKHQFPKAIKLIIKQVDNI